MAESIIEEMLTAGVMPGPKAHHAVVFAYVKAGDADSALTAIRRTHNSGDSYFRSLRYFCCFKDRDRAQLYQF